MTQLQKRDLASSGVVLLQTKKSDATPDEIKSKEKETISNLKQKYKDAVLFEIYENPNILHSVLANRMPVSASGLNAIIKKLNEAVPSPIHTSRQGKFTLYKLEEAGIKYVEEEILPLLVSNMEDKECVGNIFRLLSSFKDQNPKKWVMILENILNGQDEWDDYEEGSGFIKEIGVYSSDSGEEAKALLDLAIVDKELKKKIVDYLKENKNKNFESVWDVLNFWEQENTLELYRLIDKIFAIPVNGELIDNERFLLTDINIHLEKISDKIQANLLQALFKKLSKKEAIELWMAYGVETHLAIYLAEKYINCLSQFEQSTKERKSCI